MHAESTGLAEQLRETRDTLVAERAELFRKMDDLRRAVERNAREIEAADTLMLRLDPRHIALDVRTDVDPKPLLAHVAAEEPTAEGLSGAASSATSEVPSGSEPAGEPQEDRNDEEERELSASHGASQAAGEAGDTDASPAVATDEGKKSRSRSADLSENQIAINRYFKKSKRSKTLLSILKSKSEPVGTQVIVSDYKALYPLWSDDREVRALVASRISAALAYMVKKGEVVRLKQRIEGKQSEAALWQLSPNRPRRKPAGKKKAVAKRAAKVSATEKANDDGRATAH